MDTFNKRQKEMKRLDRQKEKAARRILRKQNRAGAAIDDASPDDTPKADPDSSPTEERTNDV